MNHLTQANIRNPFLNGATFNGLSGVGFFQKLIPAMISMGFFVGVIIFVFMFIAGAIQWISSGGDKAAVELAKGRIFSAFLGIVLLFALFAVIEVVGVFFNINLTLLDFDPLRL